MIRMLENTFISFFVVKKKIQGQNPEYQKGNVKG